MLSSSDNFCILVIFIADVASFINYFVITC